MTHVIHAACDKLYHLRKSCAHCFGHYYFTKEVVIARLIRDKVYSDTFLLIHIVTS